MKVFLSVILGLVFAISTGMLLRTCSETVEVAHEEFGPRASLQKYEWFKNAAAVLSQKQADIKVFQGRIDRLKSDYEGFARKGWSRTDKEQMSIWESEVAGVKASYNSLAAEYNAASSKFNWAYVEGELPPGSERLPRNIKPYIEE